MVPILSYSLWNIATLIRSESQRRLLHCVSWGHAIWRRAYDSVRGHRSATRQLNSKAKEKKAVAIWIALLAFGFTLGFWKGQVCLSLLSRCDLMSDERTTLPLLGFRAVRKSPKRKRTKKSLECLPHENVAPERVVWSDSDIHSVPMSSEWKKPENESECLQSWCPYDYRGYKTEPVSPKTPPISMAERELVTPKAPKKRVQETSSVALLEDNESGGICHACGRHCRLRPSIPVCFRLNCALEYMNEMEQR